MNERIQKLMLRAGWQNAYTDPKEGFEPVFKDEEHNLACIKKFAELLVKECCDAADMYVGVTGAVGDCVGEYMGFGTEEGITEWRAK